MDQVLVTEISDDEPARGVLGRRVHCGRHRHDDVAGRWRNAERNLTLDNRIAHGFFGPDLPDKMRVGFETRRNTLVPSTTQSAGDRLSGFRPCDRKSRVIFAVARANAIPCGFAVIDESRRIPKDKLAAAFELFQQVHASDAGDKGGSGLGRYAQSIVRQHVVRSQSPAAHAEISELRCLKHDREQTQLNPLLLG